MKYLIILILFCSCSANWHLRQAVKKNPELAKPKLLEVPIHIIDTHYVKIPGDTSEQFMKLVQWYTRAKDSTATVYQDSILKVQQHIKDGTVVTKVLRIPYEVEVPIEIHDTVKVEVQPNTLPQTESKLGIFLNKLTYLLLVIFLILLTYLLIKKT